MLDKNKLLTFKIYELKGMLGSFSAVAYHHDSYNYPLFKNIEKAVNEMVDIISENERSNNDHGKYGISTNRFRQSQGFLSKK